jgi:hypothetical protein
MIRKISIYFVLAFGLAVGGAYTETAMPPAAGESLPQFSLPTPKDSGFRQYLGLPAAESFQIAEIEADVIIIEIFNMY